MKKITLEFPSADTMAEFILVCASKDIETDMIYLTLTGKLEQRCIDLALAEYGAKISEAPDFILP